MYFEMIRACQEARIYANRMIWYDQLKIMYYSALMHGIIIFFALHEARNFLLSAIHIYFRLSCDPFIPISDYIVEVPWQRYHDEFTVVC